MEFFPHLSIFPLNHILSGKYLTSILTIPRPAILQRILEKGRSKSEMSISIRPDGPVLRVFGHLENVESNVHEANVCSQL